MLCCPTVVLRCFHVLVFRPRGITLCGRCVSCTNGLLSQNGNRCSLLYMTANPGSPRDTQVRAQCPCRFQNHPKLLFMSRIVPLRGHTVSRRVSGTEFCPSAPPLRKSDYPIALLGRCLLTVTCLAHPWSLSTNAASSS